MRVAAFLFASLVACQAQVSPGDWPIATPDSVQINPTKFQAMEAAIQAGEFKKIGSILIARHGKLVYEHYFDGDAKTLRDTRSATKSITAVLIGIAIDEKKLPGVNARMLALLPEHKRKLQNPDPRKENITVEDFLTMSSLLECDDWNDASRGNEEKMYLVEDWAQFILDLPVRGHMKIGEHPEPPKYGRDFSYCTGGVFTLSEVIQKVTGMRTDRYAQQKLFGPLGINDSTWVYSPLDVPQTGGGLRVTSADLLKIPQLYLNGGRWNEKAIVSPEWVKASTTAHAMISDHQEYGYLWWLQSFTSAADGKSYPAFYMTGNGGNKALAFPTLDMTVVITATNYNTKGMHELTEKILTDYILAAVQ